jgi:hypothetical protein
MAVVCSIEECEKIAYSKRGCKCPYCVDFCCCEPSVHYHKGDELYYMYKHKSMKKISDKKFTLRSMLINRVAEDRDNEKIIDRSEIKKMPLHIQKEIGYIIRVEIRERIISQKYVNIGNNLFMSI